MSERIGILGGAFDPPHIGHLILGETARTQLSLDRVLYLPTGDPPHKDNRTMSNVRHRLNMTRLAVEDHPHFETSTLDIKRPAPHYTATLLPYLVTAFPDAHFCLIIGGDSLRDLPQWHNPARIAEQWDIAALPRTEFTFDWDTIEAHAPGIRERTTMLDGPSVSLSSTQIRRWVAEGRSLRYIVPASVALYIQTHDLYLPGN